MMALRLTRWLVAPMLASMAAPVLADGAPSLPTSMPREWIVTVGFQVYGAPTFEGAKGYGAYATPRFKIQAAGTKEFATLPGDGYSFTVLSTDNFRFGAAGQIKRERKEADSSALRGLGDVDWAIEAGVFAEYWPADFVRARAELRRGLHGHDGVVAELSTDLFVKPLPRLTWTLGPRLSLVSDAYMQTYFGIDATQSLRSGLKQFNASGGAKSVGVASSASYDWTPQIATVVYGEYDRLLGDASDSPLVKDRGSADQFTFGAGMTYKFPVAW